MTDSPPVQHDPEVIGRYEVLEQLGQGAMGVVLLAQDPILSRRVALKYLRPDLKLHEDERALLMKRIHQEARAIARVVHPGIVALHDMGIHEKYGTYLVFEHAKGPTLQSVLERGRLTKEGVARLAHELGQALDAAHAHGVLHRDIKPGNIILTEEGAKIADFGVARLPDSTLTKAGARVGTPAYSSPESIREGEHSEKSDQFSMAACLYEALSGRRAFPGDDAVKVARAIEKDPPLPLARAFDLDPEVDEVLKKAMAQSPLYRYATCSELGSALEGALVGTVDERPPLSQRRARFRPESAQRTRFVGFALLWLLLGATLATGLFHLKDQPAETSTTAAPEVHMVRPAFLSPVPQKK